MDQAKRAYRSGEVKVKKAARDANGRDLRDRVGEAGDEARKNLGNLGDDVRRRERDRAQNRQDRPR